MPRIKNLQEGIPYDYQYLEAALGQREAFKVSGFRSLCDQVEQQRRANSHQCREAGLRLDREGVEFDVEQYNVARCQAHNWTGFLTNAAGVQELPPVVDWSKKNGGLVAGVSRVWAGAELLVEWLGDNASPVDIPIAEKRAAICAVCPKNDGGDWKAVFTVPVANKIRDQIELKHDLELHTSHDEELTVCSACDCPIALKVWAPLKYILDHMSKEVRSKLDPRCWVLHEKP